MYLLSLRVKHSKTVHGYDSDNTEIMEESGDEDFVEKVIAVSRIQSISEKYILVTSSHGRVMYWEYEGGMKNLIARLSNAGLMVE